ncbi:MAG: hypothetical protein ACOX6C_01105 [Patescibacteria group bacterium]|jgi:hypothetical protein
MERIKKVIINSDFEIIIKTEPAPQTVRYVIMGECDVIIYFTSTEGYNDPLAIARFRNINREFPGLRLYKKIGSDIFLFSNRMEYFRKISKKKLFEENVK